MLHYVLRRILISMPTLLIISMAVFGLSKCAPGDPIVNIFGTEINTIADPEVLAVMYQRNAAELGLDKPLFYFGFSTAAQPDTLWKIYPFDRRERLSVITAQTGNWHAAYTYDQAVQQSIKALNQLPDSLPQKAFLRLALLDLSTKSQLDKLRAQFQAVENVFAQISPAPSGLQEKIEALRARVNTVCTDLMPEKLWTPALRWNGINNQYHHWLHGFLSGNWGLTKQRRPVWQELQPALFATMAVNMIALFFAYLIAIPLGVEMARRKGGAFDRLAQRILIFIQAMPVFWMGALLVMLLCSPIWGKPLIQSPYLDISYAWDMNKEPFLQWFSAKLPKFVLPILVLTLYSLTIITLQMRGGMLEILGQDFIRTARAKGVQEEEVYWSHAFRNALFPVITIFASVFPAMFTGSLVIETMFNFPGMGLKAQEAFAGHDLAILSAILMAAAVFTILGNLVADLLYGWADPRVRFVKDK